MYKTLAIVAFAVITTAASAQTKVSVDSVATHIGEKVVVCSEVFGVKTTDKITFINVGAPYPKSPLTVIVFAKNLANFNESPAALYYNKKICVTGKLENYHGKPQIVVTKPDEITLQ